MLGILLRLKVAIFKIQMATIDFTNSAQITKLKINSMVYYLSSINQSIPFKYGTYVSEYNGTYNHITRIGSIYIINFSLKINCTHGENWLKDCPIMTINKGSNFPLMRPIYFTVNIMENGKNKDQSSSREGYFDGNNVILKLFNNDSGWVFGNISAS